MSMETRMERRCAAAIIFRERAATAETFVLRDESEMIAQRLKGCMTLRPDDDPATANTLKIVAEVMEEQGNYADEYAADYARFAVRFGLDPQLVSRWAHLATLEAESPVRWLKRRELRRVMEAAAPEMFPGTSAQLAGLSIVGGARL